MHIPIIMATPTIITMERAEIHKEQTDRQSVFPLLRQVSTTRSLLPNYTCIAILCFSIKDKYPNSK